MVKEEVHQAILTEIHNRTKALKAILSETLEATENDSKSSAGDKHETAISMAQLEQEKLTNQINILLNQERELQKINPKKSHILVDTGSLIETDKGWYYLAIGLGSVKMNDLSIFCVSPLAPIGQLLIGKKSGDSIEYNGNKTTLLSLQ